jgi:hypothetical protein
MRVTIQNDDIPVLSRRLSGEGAYLIQFLFGIDAKKEKKKIIIKKQ